MDFFQVYVSGDGNNLYDDRNTFSKEAHQINSINKSDENAAWINGIICANGIGSRGWSLLNLTIAKKMKWINVSANSVDKEARLAWRLIESTIKLLEINGNRASSMTQTSSFLARY